MDTSNIHRTKLLPIQRHHQPLASSKKPQKTIHNNKLDETANVSLNESQYLPIFQAEEGQLDINLARLEEEKQQREKAFNARLFAIHQSAYSIKQKIKEEEIEAEREFSEMDRLYGSSVIDISGSLSEEINSIFSAFDNDIIPTEVNEVDMIVSDIDLFFKTTVPESISKQSGQVDRNLKKLHDMFDMDKQKTFQRETDIVDRASEHVNRTQQRFHDDAALFSSAMFNLEEDIIADERREAMLGMRRHEEGVSYVLKLRQKLLEEEQKRENEDDEILSTIVETQSLLQQAILNHFGTSGEDGDVDAVFGPFTRLESRMSRRGSESQSSVLPDNRVEQSVDT